MKEKIFTMTQPLAKWGVDKLCFVNEHDRTEEHFQRCIKESLSVAGENTLLQEFLYDLSEEYYHQVASPAVSAPAKAHKPAPAPEPVAEPIPEPAPEPVVEPEPPKVEEEPHHVAHPTPSRKGASK